MGTIEIPGKTLKGLVARVASVVSKDTTRSMGISSLHLFASESGGVLVYGTDGHRVHRSTRGDVREMFAGMSAWNHRGELPKGWGYYPVAQRDLADFKNAIDTDNNLVRLETQHFAHASGHEGKYAPPSATLVLAVYGERRFFYTAESGSRANVQTVIPQASMLIEANEKCGTVSFERLAGWAKSAPEGKWRQTRIHGAPFDPTTGKTGWALSSEGHDDTFLLSVDAGYLAEGAKAVKSRGQDIEVSIGGDLDPLVLQVGNPSQDTGPEDETHTVVIMPIRR